MNAAAGNTLGTMMSSPLTIDVLVRRAASHGDTEIVSRTPDKTLVRTTWKKVAARATRLAHALVRAGVEPGDRIASLMWNHSEHVELYLGVPLAGAVLHTLNLRLHPDEIAYIAADAGDRMIIVDDVLLPLFEKIVAAGAKFERVFVVGAEPKGRERYEQLLESGEPTVLPTLHEDQALGTCYTSGTTGKPKGVVYTHRSTLLHSLVLALPDQLSLARRDTLMPVVPMFHVMAWGLPYGAAFVGCRLIMPGPFLDAANLVDLLIGERVTAAAGVPTLWIGIRDLVLALPEKPELQPGLRMIVGGSAAPLGLIRDFDTLGMPIVHAWGMTETSPVGLVSRVPPEADDLDYEAKLAIRAKQGLPPPLIEIDVRNEEGSVPHDDRTVGELVIRGPWVAGSYVGGHLPDRWTNDGFFRTEDVAKIDAMGIVQLTDRVTDLVKSGGEWISSQELENALMGHPAVKEAAVIGVQHEKWSERPIAIVVFREGQSATAEALRAYLAPSFAKFWLPDAFEIVESIPRTTTGKFLKTALRKTYKDYKL